MFLKDFTFDESGTAGWPIDKTHFLEVTKKVDINAETFTFDIEFTNRETLPGGTISVETKNWENLDPVAAQCIIFELFEGRFNEPTTQETD